MKATDILKAVGEVDEEVIANAKKNQKSKVLVGKNGLLGIPKSKSVV